MKDLIVSEEISSERDDSRLCFVIAPIGEVGSEARRHADQILERVIAPACLECGYKPLRADQIAEPGLITTQIIERLVAAEIVIADLTGRNPNVFYELAIRHVFRKPVIQLIQVDERIPFDVTGLRTIYIDRDIERSEAANRSELAEHIRAAERQSPDEVESPVSVALDRAALRSGGPVEVQIAKVLDALNTLNATIEAQRVVNIAALEARGMSVPDHPPFAFKGGGWSVSDVQAFKELVEHFSGGHPWHDPSYSPDIDDYKRSLEASTKKPKT